MRNVDISIEIAGKITFINIKKDGNTIHLQIPCTKCHYGLYKNKKPFMFGDDKNIETVWNYLEKELTE